MFRKIILLIAIISSNAIVAQEDKVYENIDEAITNKGDVFFLDLSNKGLKKIPKEIWICLIL